MKKLITFLLFLGLGFLAAAQEQKNPEIAQLIRENIWRAGVNLCQYEVVPAPETPVPKGYKPFYISHYGRHGSRSDWSGDRYPSVQNCLHQALEQGILTAEGQQLSVTVDRLIAAHNGMNGRLTDVGAREHRQIAGRMYDKYKKVFSAKRKVHAISSTVPRCLVSMNAFTAELLSRNPKLDMTWDTGEESMKICSSGDSKEIRKAVKEILRKQRKLHKPDTLAFLSRVFTDADAARQIVGNTTKFMQNVYWMAAVCGSFELGDGPYRLFTEDDLYWYCQLVGMDIYLRQCNSKPFGDERMEPTKYLLQDIIDRADEAIASGDCAANLRFGHDWHLLAISSRIGIKGIAERGDVEWALNWPSFLYTPFAANLQMVFYKNREDQVLVKFYINERETTLIGLEGGPYYKWEDVKQAWNS